VQYKRAPLTPKQRRSAEAFQRQLEAYATIPESLRPRWVTMLRRLAGKHDVGWICWLRDCRFAVRGTTLIIKTPLNTKYTHFASHAADFEDGWGARVDIRPPENVVRDGR
jgi:hypothetical protein